MVPGSVLKTYLPTSDTLPSGWQLDREDTHTEYDTGTSGELAVETATPLAAGNCAPPPRLAATDNGCASYVLGAVAVGPILLMLPFLWSSHRTGSLPAAILTILVLGAVLGALPAVGCIVLTRRRRRDRSRAQAEFQAYAALYPPLLAVWSAALLCHRCHVGFVPQGRFGPSAEPAQAVPLPYFHGMVQGMARRMLV